MSDMRFFGIYATCRSENKNKGAHLIGPDNIVGNEVTLDFRKSDGKTVVWAVNKFGADMGYFDNQTSYLLDVTHARGWKMHALLSMVGLTDYTEEDKDITGYYWAEVIVFAFATKYEEYTSLFNKLLSEKLSDGVRPDINLTSSSIDTLLQNKGNWIPSKKLPNPTKKKGTVIIKKSMKPSEAAIEAGRNKNIGCYIVSYAFIAIVVIGIVLLVKFLAGF